MDKPTALDFIRALFTGTLLLTTPLSSFAENAAPVAVITPAAKTATQQIRLSGTVVAAKRSQLSARVDGAVASVLVDGGSQVAEGQLLIELDDKLEQHELQRLNAMTRAAQAVADEDQRLVTEAKKLTRENHLPQTELDLRQAALASSSAALDAAKAQLATQQQRLAYHQIKAPFAGVVVQKLTEAGEWVSRGTPVIELVATDPVYLDVQIPQEQFTALTDDTTIVIKPDTDPALSLNGKIAARVPVADSRSRTFRLRLVADAAGDALPPGSSATAIFTTLQSGQQVLTVPRDAVLRNPDNSFAVFVVTKQDQRLTAERRQVAVGRFLGSDAEITSGIKPNEPVVVRGNEILRNGQAVSLIQTASEGQN